MGKYMSAWIDGKSVSTAGAGLDLVSPLTAETLYRIIESDDATKEK